MDQDRVISIGLPAKVAGQVAAACRTLGVDHSARDGADGLRDDPATLAIAAIGEFDAVDRVRPELGVIVIASVADSAATIEAMKRGAIECLLLPVSDETLAEQISEALQSGRDEREAKPRKAGIAGANDGIIGQSPVMQQVYKLIGLIAPRNVNLLITGESGTGKEVVARAVHAHSSQASGPLLAVNCAAIPDTLLESELFGHERGAFTGADRRKIGKFEQARDGTLFLDEIGDMPLATQAKVLRVLQDQSFQRLGGTESIQTNARIIAATHQPLEQLIAAKAFRQDLYYRLKVATIHLPPLREREVDVVLLAHYFVDRFNSQFGTHVRSFSPEAVAALLSYAWPGNVRELENVIKASLLAARGTIFRPEFLPANVRSKDGAPPTSPALGTHQKQQAPTGLGELAARILGDPANHGSAHKAMIAEVETVLIVEALNRSKGEFQAAAQLLGISRTTLRDRIARYGIGLKAVGGESDGDA